MTPILQAVAPELLPFASQNIADAVESLNARSLDAATDIVAGLPLARVIDMFDRPELQRAGSRREQKHSDELAQRMRFRRTQHDQLLPH